MNDLPRAKSAPETCCEDDSVRLADYGGKTTAASVGGATVTKGKGSSTFSRRQSVQGREQVDWRPKPEPVLHKDLVVGLGYVGEAN